MIDLEILSNQQIKEIYYDVYNGFWKNTEIMFRNGNQKSGIELWNMKNS